MNAIPGSSRGQKRNPEDQSQFEDLLGQLRTINEQLLLVNLEIQQQAQDLQASLLDLEAAGRFFRALGELVPYGIWVCGPDGRVVYLSDSFLEMVGMTLEECRQSGWTSRLPPEDVERTLADWQRCVETGSFWEHEHRLRDREGWYHTILSRGAPVWDEAGRMMAWVGFHLDISERKRLEEDLLKARAELEQRVELRTAELSRANEQLRQQLAQRQPGALESEVGKGTTSGGYVLASAEAANGEPHPGTPDATETILVVDDDDGWREVLRELFRTQGYGVHGVASGSEALAYLKEHPVDLLILDMIMPGGMDGTDTYQRVLEVRPGQRAIIVSAFGESERVRQALALGAAAYLPRPVPLQKLAWAVRNALQRN